MDSDQSNARTMSVSEMRERLLAKSAGDDEFRARLLANPKSAIQDELGLVIPDQFTIAVHEEAAGTGHLVLPPSSKLSEEELSLAAGGSGDEWWNTGDDLTDGDL